MMKKKVALLGASGSIGSQSIDILNKHAQEFELVSFSVGRQVNKVSDILAMFPRVKKVCVMDEEEAKKLAKSYPNIEFFAKDEGLLKILDDADIVINALVGFVGLLPSIEALKKNKILCLANKESLVTGGEIINDLLAKGHGKLYPIDSEHVAIAKCLIVDSDNVDKIILTASGGAFRDWPIDKLDSATPEDALKHPTWTMGKKITVDCANMANKAFEIIEAYYLFNYSLDKIDVLPHDESYIHSLVRYSDGSYRASVGKADMRPNIEFALMEENIDFETITFSDYHELKECHFRELSLERYPMLSFAKVVMENRGTYGTVFNAADEVAAQAFLEHKIKFTDVFKVVKKMMDEHQNIIHPSLEEIVRIDKETRLKTAEIIKDGKF